MSCGRGHCAALIPASGPRAADPAEADKPASGIFDLISSHRNTSILRSASQEWRGCVCRLLAQDMGICMELTEDGKQAIVSLGSQVQTLSRARLRTESNRRSCVSGQPSSQPSAATLSGRTGSILPAGQGFHRWTPQLHMLQRGCRGRKQPNPFQSVEILSPFILSRKCSGPLLHTRCEAPSVTMGQVLSPSLPPV